MEQIIIKGRQYLGLYPTILLFAFVAFTSNIYAGVTIGSGKSPVKGALLDLKEYDIDDAESVAGSTATKGVNLPRVRLVESDKLYPMFDGMTNASTYNKGGIDYPKADEDARHKGLMVYNLATIPAQGLSEGVYYWSGASWEKGIGPWNQVGTTKPATDNQQDVYLNGKVAIGRDTLIADGALSVYGNLNIMGTAANPAVSPSAILDIQSDNQGILMPRIYLQSVSDATTIVKPAKGLMVYNTNSSMIKGEGFYVNYGNEEEPNWMGFINNLPDDTDQYQFAGFGYTTASSHVIVNAPAMTTHSSTPLGIELSIILPPKSENQISITYSLPAGTYTGSPSSTYFGVKLTKQIGTGIEEESPGGSRKYTAFSAVGQAFFMATMTATTVDTVENPSNSSITVKYKLYAYVENNSSSLYEFIYNRWYDANDPTANYNWGIGAMTSQTYTKATQE